MIIPIHVFSKTQVARIREQLDKSDWVDGRVTAGSQASGVKINQQLPERSPLARQLGDAILTALANHPLLISAALPLKIYPPMFNRYRQGETYGHHVDNAIRVVPDAIVRVRTDVSATLFLSEPDEYEGGELTIEGKYGEQTVKLPAGDMILYPSCSLHRVAPITSGMRVSSFFWMQSMVRHNEQREMLFDLDQSIQSLTHLHGHQHDDVMRLTGIYQNMIRLWSDT